MNTTRLREFFEAFVDAPSAGNLTPLLVRVVIDEFLTDRQIECVSGAIGYAFRAELRAEQLSDADVVENSGHRAVLDYFYDTTKSVSDDVMAHYPEAFRKAVLYIHEGSPVRKGDGQRLVPAAGVHPTCSINFYVR